MNLLWLPLPLLYLLPLLQYGLFVDAGTFIPSDNTSWQQYIVAPKSRRIAPIAILSRSGNVSNAEALITREGVTRLYRAASSDDVPQVVLDFGQNVVGFLQISFAGASANNPGIRLAFSETQEYLTKVSDFTRSDNGDTITPGTDQVAVPAAPVVWTDVHGCQYGSQVCADGLHGFRYLRLSLDALASDAPYAEPYGAVDIESLSLNFTAYLGLPASYTGWFECSDEQLNRFWYDAAYTDEMVIDTFLADYVDPRDAASPSLLGKTVIFDGAKRDRDPYVGDLAVSARTAYLTHMDANVAARNVIADLADHQREDGWIPPASINNYTLPLFDYPLWWVTTSWDYVLYTGDLDYAETYYPNLVKVLDSWYPSVTNATTGLLSKGLNNTSGYGDYAFLPREGEITYFNALYVLALKNAAELATVFQQTDDAARWQQRAETVSQAINEYLWNANTGAYLDSSTGSVRHGQDGNAIAILAGVANSSQARSALDYLASHTALPYGNAFMDNDSLVSGGSTRVYAFISYFDIAARFLTGDADSAIDEIRRLYGWMADHDPGLTFWEGIGANGSAYEGAYTSMAHGWSTGVLPALTNYLLGIQPTAPGYQRFSVRPSFPAGVTWARGQQATKFGPVYVDWSVDGGKITINVDVPQGTVGDISISQSDSKQVVYLDGEEVWDGFTSNRGRDVQQNGGYITLVGVSPGSHSILSTSTL
ncbi:hypothetical protein VTN77DRAFT_311 [Rasamsonia byssochlamydoides]|uniref:uncharacterized protein n=1 Tax=Rasamsonia byssochlamydoides TaxID=89139 RepID=UPI00374310FD